MRAVLIGAVGVALVALKPLALNTYCGEPTLRAALSDKAHLHHVSGTDDRAVRSRAGRACINQARHQVVESGLLLVVASVPLFGFLDPGSGHPRLRPAGRFTMTASSN